MWRFLRLPFDSSWNVFYVLHPSCWLPDTSLLLDSPGHPGDGRQDHDYARGGISDCRMQVKLHLTCQCRRPNPDRGTANELGLAFADKYTARLPVSSAATDPMSV